MRIVSGVPTGMEGDNLLNIKRLLEEAVGVCSEAVSRDEGMEGYDKHTGWSA